MKLSKNDIEETTRLCAFLGELFENLEDGSASISGSYENRKADVLEAIGAAHALYQDLLYEYYLENGGITGDMK